MSQEFRLKFLFIIVLVLLLISCGDDNPVDSPDTTAPAVIATSPAGGTELASVFSTISVTFSEEMKLSTMTTVALSIEPPISGSVSYSEKVLVFTPDTSLLNGTTYMVKVNTSVADRAGNTLSEPYPWQFSTYVDTLPPTIVSTIPFDQEQYAPRNTAISVTFSEEMDSTSLMGDIISIQPETAFSKSVSDSTLTITPTGLLDSAITYTITINQAATDTAGNALIADYEWQFSTYPDTILPSVSFTTPVEQGVVDSLFSARVEASDNSRLDRVEFYLDTSSIPAATDYTPPYLETISLTAIDIGTVHQVIAVAVDASGNSSADTVSVHYLWRLLLQDGNEPVVRNINNVYARSSPTMIEFRVETNGGWNVYWDPEEGIDMALFFDVDQNPATGQTTVSGGTIPINDIGADYRVIIGLHGNVFDEFIDTMWVNRGGPNTLTITDSTNYLEFGLLLSRLGSPDIFDLVVANYTWNELPAPGSFQWDWAPDQGSGHITYVVDHSYNGSPPTNGSWMQNQPTELSPAAASSETGKPNPFD